MTANLNAATEAAQKELEKRGFLLSEYQSDSPHSLIVGSRQAAVNMPDSESCPFYVTHEHIADERFTSMIERTISESPLQMIICPDKEAAQHLISAGKEIGISPNPSANRPPVVCMGEDVPAGYGFTAVKNQEQLFAFIRNEMKEVLLHS